MYSPHDSTLWVISSRYADAGPFALTATLYDLQARRAKRLRGQ